MCFGGSPATTTQTQTTTPAPQAALGADNAMAAALSAYNTPFSQPLQQVAQFSPLQQQAFDLTQSNLGNYQPYYDQANQLFGQSAKPLTENDIAQYLNPYANYVMGGLQDVFGQQMAQTTGQLTQSAGGVGADRIAVGQSELARQQGLTAGQTLANIYQPALAAAQQQKQMEQAAAYGLGNLGTANQQAGYTDINALYGMGSQIQNLQQQGLNAQYQYDLAKAMFPYQNSQFLTGSVGALAPIYGGTATGTQTTPPPSATSQVIGLGTAALGAAGKIAPMFIATGGRVSPYDVDFGYASGGVPDDMITIGPGYDPIAPLNLVPGEAAASAPTRNPFDSLGTGLIGLSEKLPKTAAASTSSSPPPLAVKLPTPVQQAIRLPYGAQSFAAGGAPDDYFPDFAPTEAGFFSAPSAMMEPGVRDELVAYGSQSPYAPIPLPQPRPASAPQMADDALPDAAAPTAGLYPTAAGPNAAPGLDLPTIGPSAVAPLDITTPSTSIAPVKSREDYGGDPWMALMAAGLGMMASTSPYAMVNVGKGGLEGVKAYERSLEESRKRRSVDQEAQRLAQQADQFNRQLNQTKELHNTMTPYQQANVDLEKAKLRKPMAVSYGQTLVTPEGEPLYSNRIAASNDAVELLADRVLAGDKSALQNIGRGAQGVEMLAAVHQAVARKAVERGLDGPAIAALNANFMAQSAAARNAAVRTSQIDTAVEEARNTFPLALKASEALPRTQFVPLNKAIQMVERGTSSPELAQFVTANRAVITAYAQAMSRTGLTTVHAQQAAEDLLSTATSKEAYKAVIAQMDAEMKAAQRAPDTVRKQILKRIGKRDEEEPAPAPAAASAPSSIPAPDKREKGKVYDLPNGKRGRWNGSGWELVQ